MSAKKAKKREPIITVGLPLSVARDVITVLAKFSAHKADELRLGEIKHADRLLRLNLWRVGLEEQIRDRKEK